MELPSACRDMFRRHRVEAFGGVFHVPAAAQYPCLYAWDSGYHALSLRHLDRQAAATELRTLYAANTMATGLLAHERPLPGAEARTARVVEWMGPLFRPDGLSWLIDPPVPAYAAATLFDPALDPATDLLVAAHAHLAAIDRHCTLTPDGAPVILHPLESGADVSPLFDSLVDASSGRAMLASHKALSQHVAAIEYSAAAAMASGHAFIVSDPIFCGWHLLALEALADAWRRAGRPDQARPLDDRAASLTAAMLEQLWCEDLALFVGFDHVGGRQLPVATLGGIIAAASRSMIAAGAGAKVVSAHLQPATSRFWGSAGVAFNLLDGREIEPRAMLWRGDVVWGATQYWAHLVLARNGLPRLATKARLQMEALIARSGFREYYSAATGQGYGAGEVDGFTWPALVLEMRAEESALAA